MPSFVTIDMEHCNSSYASVCSLGASRVAGGEVVASRHYFVRPPEPFDCIASRNMALCGLDPDDIAQGLDWPHVADIVRRSVADSVVVLHNVSADLPMWLQASLASGLDDLPRWRVIDTVDLATRLGLPRKLGLLHDALFGADFDHHNAEADAIATARVAVEMMRRIGATPDELARPYRFRPMTLAQVKLPTSGRRLPPRRQTD